MGLIYSAQKATVRMHCTPGNGVGHSLDCKHLIANYKHSSDRIKALGASVATLSMNVNIKAVNMGVKKNNNNNMKLAADGKWALMSRTLFT